MKKNLTSEQLFRLNDVIKNQIQLLNVGFYAFLSKGEKNDEVDYANKNHKLLKKSTDLIKKIEMFFESQYKDEIESPILSDEEILTLKEACEHYYKFKNLLIDVMEIKKVKNSDAILKNIEKEKFEIEQAKELVISLMEK